MGTWGVRRWLGLVVTVLGFAVILSSTLIRAERSTIPPSKEEVQAKKRRRQVGGGGTVLFIYGLLLVLMP